MHANFVQKCIFINCIPANVTTNMNKLEDMVMNMKRSSPEIYMESGVTCTPANKHVLYVEVVPAGFVKLEHLAQADDDHLQDIDPLVATDDDSKPILLAREKKKLKNHRRLEKHKKKHFEKEEIKKSNSIYEEVNSDFNCESEEKLVSYSPLSSLPSPNRSISPDSELFVNKKPERRKLTVNGAKRVRKKKPHRRKRAITTNDTNLLICSQPDCSFTSVQLSEYKRHKKEMHVIIKTKDFYCDQCAYRGATSSDLRKHYRQHSGELPYACKVPNCNFTAKHTNSLVYHTKKYHPIGDPMKCDESENCKFSSYLKSAMKHHKMIHHGSGKTVSCDKCPYKCYLMADLKKHLRTHSGESPYVCDYEGCRYSCKISSNLKKHKRSHTEEKPYICDVCHFRTNFINSLKVHKRTHTNERPYFCNHCGYRCNHTSNLKKHIARLHSKIDDSSFDKFSNL